MPTILPAPPRVGCCISVPILALIIGIIGGGSAAAQDQTPPCPAYVIEGTIDPVNVSDPGAPRTASVYVHLSDEPVANHRVIATFNDATGAVVGETIVVSTDAGGRASVDVPTGAESVDFVAESPSAIPCTTADGSDPHVILQIVPVESVPSGAMSPPVADEPQGELAKTGPVSEVIVLVSLLLLAFGATVGTGWGRRRATSPGSTDGKRRITG